MPYIVVTLDVSKWSGWLNALACSNILVMLVTLDVSKLSGWLKAIAPLNIHDMSVTLDVLLKLSGWLNVMDVSLA